MVAPVLFSIHWIDLSGSLGHEQNAIRPGLVVATHTTGLATIIPLTTTEEAKHFPYTLKIRKNGTNLLIEDSIALIFQMRSVDFQKRAKGNLGIVTGKELDLVKSQIKIYLKL